MMAPMSMTFRGLIDIRPCIINQFTTAIAMRYMQGA